MASAARAGRSHHVVGQLQRDNRQAWSWGSRSGCRGRDSQPPEEAPCEEKWVFLTRVDGFGDKRWDHLLLRSDSSETRWLWAAPAQRDSRQRGPRGSGAQASAQPAGACLLVSCVVSLGLSQRPPRSQGGGLTAKATRRPRRDTGARLPPDTRSTHSTWSVRRCRHPGRFAQEGETEAAA